MVEIIPFILPVIVAYECRRLGRAICGSILALSACAVLIFSERSPLIYGYGWHSFTTAIPVLVLAGVAILWVSRGRQKLSLVRQQQIMLIVCVAALCSVVQFPFAAPIYFCYVAPLVILSATALFASAGHPPRFVLGALIVFYLLFAVLRVTPGFIYYMGLRYAPDAQIQRLTLARAGGLRVAPAEAHVYEQLIPFIQSHASGKFIYCTQDCPEVYFLSGLDNPTRTTFDFLDDPRGRTDRIMSLLESRKVNVVAIKHGAINLSRSDPALEGALDQRFPHSARIQTFEVRWDQ
jgi:hypothetical protein